jgi:serine/threonine protein phosphatase PrpC
MMLTKDGKKELTKF